jgi:hypothetical protein
MALGFALLACMGLAAYRMGFGDDHGHFHSRQLILMQERDVTMARPKKKSSKKEIF